MVQTTLKHTHSHRNKVSMVSIQKRRPKEVKNHQTVRRGDVFWADLSLANVGSEQNGVRPVVVIQNDVGNRFSTTVIVACVTSQIDKANLPTHVEVGKEHGLPQNSVVLLEQIRTIDKQRLSNKITSLNDDIMREIDRATLISLGLA